MFLNSLVVTIASVYSPIVCSRRYSLFVHQSYASLACCDNPDEKRWDDHKAPQQVDIPPEEREKHWYDLDDDRKRQLEVRTTRQMSRSFCPDLQYSRSAAVSLQVLLCSLAVSPGTSTASIRARRRSAHFTLVPIYLGLI